MFPMQQEVSYQHVINWDSNLRCRPMSAIALPAEMHCCLTTHSQMKRQQERQTKTSYWIMYRMGSTSTDRQWYFAQKIKAQSMGYSVFQLSIPVVQSSDIGSQFLRRWFSVVRKLHIGPGVCMYNHWTGMDWTNFNALFVLSNNIYISSCGVA